MHSFLPLARSPRVWLVNEIVHFIALLLPCFLCFCSLTLKATAAVGPVASFMSHCETFLGLPMCLSSTLLLGTAKQIRPGQPSACVPGRLLQPQP